MTYQQQLDILRAEFNDINERIMQRHKTAQAAHVINTALYRHDTPNNVSHIDRNGRLIATTKG